MGCYKSISLRFYYNLWSLWQKLLSLKRLRRCKLFGLKFREQTHQEVANKLGIDTTQKECVSSRFEMFSPQILKFVVISNKFNEEWRGELFKDRIWESLQTLSKRFRKWQGYQVTFMVRMYMKLYCVQNISNTIHTTFSFRF